MRQFKTNYQNMKKYILSILFLILLSQIPVLGQGVAISGLYTHGSYYKYQNALGYEIAYTLPIKQKSRLGFSFSQSFNNTYYEYVFESDADGRDYYRKVNPKNQRLVLSADFTVRILNKEKDQIFVGPAIGLNFFITNESVDERTANESAYDHYNSSGLEAVRGGISLLLEYDRSVFSNYASLFIATRPEAIFFSRSGLMGSADPFMVGNLNFNLGIRFHLNREKKE